MSWVNEDGKIIMGSRVDQIEGEKIWKIDGELIKRLNSASSVGCVFFINVSWVEVDESSDCCC